MSTIAQAEAITAQANFSPIYHYGASVRPKRVAWVVEFVVLHPVGSGKRGFSGRCCDTTHGHRTQDTARSCFARKWAKIKKESEAA